MNIIKKNDFVKIVLDGRHLNSNTEQLPEAWPLVSLTTQPAKAKNYI